MTTTDAAAMKLQTIRSVIDRVLWTAGATSENRALLAEAIADAIATPAQHKGGEIDTPEFRKLLPSFGADYLHNTLPKLCAHITTWADARRPATLPSELLAQAIEQCDGCMDATQVEPEDAAAWQIVRAALKGQANG